MTIDRDPDGHFHCLSVFPQAKLLLIEWLLIAFLQHSMYTTTKYCYKTRHSGSTILNCYEHWFFSVTLYSFTSMGFFNQQSHNMPKSGVSFGAVIIFHVKKYTVLISKLICMSCTHTVMNIISRRDGPLILQSSGLTWPRLAIVPW